MIFVLLAITIWLSICMLGLSKRVTELEKAMPAKIEQASHAAFYDGFLYANQCHDLRHPRDPKTKQFVSRT